LLLGSPTYFISTMRLALVAPLALFAAGCCNDHVTGASTSLSPDLLLGWYVVWVGDTARTYSAATSAPSQQPIWCDNTVYTSHDQPRRFTYTTIDPTVATIDEFGRLAAHAPGQTGIVTTTAGISDTTVVIVGPAFASLRITVSPQFAHVGDTVSVQLEALDAAGAAVPGAEAYLVEIDNYRDSLATWIRTARPTRPFPAATVQTPFTDRLVLERTGVLRIVAIAPHDTSRPIDYPADTLTLTIPSR
jgi:hypothetical protein